MSLALSGLLVMGAGMIVPQVVRLRRQRSTDGLSGSWVGVGIAINSWLRLVGRSGAGGSVASATILARVVHLTRRWAQRVLVLLAIVTFAACGSGGDDDQGRGLATSGAPAEDAEELFPDVVDVAITPLDGGEFRVAATLSSPYDSPERYADAWRVLDQSGNVLGVRELAHDHAAEQPFTRQTTISIPSDVNEVTVEGRDQVSGYGGETITVTVPREP